MIIDLRLIYSVSPSGFMRMIFENYIECEAYFADKAIDFMVKSGKGTRRMPWHQKTMKDVVSCDKLRVRAHIC